MRRRQAATIAAGVVVGSIIFAWFMVTVQESGLTQALEMPTVQNLVGVVIAAFFSWLGKHAFEEGGREAEALKRFDDQDLR